MRSIQLINNKFHLVGCFVSVILMVGTTTIYAAEIAESFELDYTSNGYHVGFGKTLDIPVCGNCPTPRTSHRFFSIFPNYQRNLTGLVSENTPWHGALYWHMEGGLAVITDNNDSDVNKYLINFSPLMVQYRFFDPEQNWIPKILGGVGFALTDWTDYGGQALNSDFQFLVHLGVGAQVFQDRGSYSIDYRLLHVSNAGTDNPNIGINAHLFSITFPF